MTTNQKVGVLFKKLEAANTAVSKIKEQINVAQESCNHSWKFIKQLNCYSETTWMKCFKCAECSKEKKEEGSPVCGDCQHMTTRQDNPDGTPVAYVTTMEVPVMDGGSWRIRGFKCNDPNCGKITLLWVNGD